MRNNSAGTRDTHRGLLKMSIVRRELENSKVLNLFSVPKPGTKRDRNILLVYRDFGIYVDAHSKVGTPDRLHDAFTWEGSPQSVVMYGNYLVAVSPHLVEIRRVNGRTEQLIPGRNWKLVSGDVVVVPSTVRSGSTASSSSRTTKLEPPQSVLLCQREPSKAHPGFDEQRIFQVRFREP